MRDSCIWTWALPGGSNCSLFFCCEGRHIFDVAWVFWGFMGGLWLWVCCSLRGGSVWCLLVWVFWFCFGFCCCWVVFFLSTAVALLVLPCGSLQELLWRLAWDVPCTVHGAPGAPPHPGLAGTGQCLSSIIVWSLLAACHPEGSLIMPAVFPCCTDPAQPLQVPYQGLGRALMELFIGEGRQRKMRLLTRFQPPNRSETMWFGTVWGAVASNTKGE